MTELIVLTGILTGIMLGLPVGLTVARTYRVIRELSRRRILP